jgi:hypothetical protein
VTAVVTALLLAAALVLLHVALLRTFGPALAAAGVALLATGTFALDLLLQADMAAAAALAATGLAVLACDRRPRGAAVPAIVAAVAFALVHADGALTIGRWQPGLALFGSRQGLLHLTPVLWLALIGLAVLFRRAPRAAAPGALMAAALVLVHAAFRAEGGGPCPRAHLAPLLALLALPLAEALRALRDLARRAPLVPLAAASALAVCWNLLFMQQYAQDMIPRDFPVAFPAVARNAAALTARGVGAPLSWPANWLFARRHRVSADRFDAAAGKALPRAADGALVLDVGGRDDEALLLEGWSVRHPCGASVCREVESQARVLLPAERNGAPVDVVVRLGGAGEVGLRVPPSRDGMVAVTIRGPALVDEVRVRAAEAP